MAAAPRTVARADTISVGNCCKDASDRYIDVKQEQGAAAAVLCGRGFSLSVAEELDTVDNCRMGSMGGITSSPVPKSMAPKLIGGSAINSLSPKCHTTRLSSVFVARRSVVPSCNIAAG